jgi:hypothetical protein
LIKLRLGADYQIKHIFSVARPVQFASVPFRTFGSRILGLASAMNFELAFYSYIMEAAMRFDSTIIGKDYSEKNLRGTDGSDFIDGKAGNDNLRP